jgi:hypothetical protein
VIHRYARDAKPSPRQVPHTVPTHAQDLVTSFTKASAVVLGVKFGIVSCVSIVRAASGGVECTITTRRFGTKYVRIQKELM